MLKLLGLLATIFNVYSHIIMSEERPVLIVFYWEVFVFLKYGVSPKNETKNVYFKGFRVDLNSDSYSSTGKGF